MNLPALSFPKAVGKLDFLKNLILAAPIIGIITAAVIVIFVVWPKFTEAQKLKESNEELQKRVENLNDKAQRLSKLDRGLLEKQLIAAEQVIPSDKELFVFIRQIESSGATSGVLIDHLDVSPGAVSGNTVATAPNAPPPVPPAAGQPGELAADATSVQLKMTLSSDYRSFLQFLGTTLSLTRVVSIGDFVLGASSTPGQAPQIRSSMTIQGYWKSLPTQLSSIESPIEELTKSEAEMLSQVNLPTASGEPSQPSVGVVDVPIGKQDLFAPF